MPDWGTVKLLDQKDWTDDEDGKTTVDADSENLLVFTVISRHKIFGITTGSKVYMLGVSINNATAHLLPCSHMETGSY